jgi:predicted metalloprotease
MRWRGRTGSANVEDRRGSGRGGLPISGRGAGLGCGGLILIILISMLFGADPQQLISILEQSGEMAGPAPPSAQLPGGYAGGGAPSDELGQFSSVVLADTEQTWSSLVRGYREPTLVLFTGAVRSACGMNSSAVGPFYCPADSKVYLDLGFFDVMSQRLGAPGDFAQAYVIAHEVGHHVQNLLGISEQVERARRSMSERESNALSVRVELQADCYAGVWAYHAHRERQLLEPGDVEEGLGAAAAIGDDQLQRQSTGYVRPESWTHGSSADRVAWLRRGLETGDPDECNTFG